VTDVDAMEVQFTEVDRAGDRARVRAYMSQVHVDPNVAVELFMLVPEKAAPAASAGA
jgi:hypothetical protein